MFLQSVFFAHYQGIFCIYMPLTSTVTLFLNLDFLCISSAFLPIHFLHYRQNIHLSKSYVLSRIVFVNIEDIFSIYLIITLCLWHISYENCFISSDICLETSNFFLYLQTKIMWYCNRYLCLFLDFHVPMPWVYNNFWFLTTLTHRLKPVGLR